MRNNFFIFLIFFVFLIKTSVANEFKFETSEIKVLENGNLISAKNGKAISTDKDLEISAKDFKYFKDKKLLKTLDGEVVIKSKNLRIKFDSMEFDEISSIYTAENNITIDDFNRELTIKTKKIIYDNNNKILKSSTNSIIQDKINNILDTESFVYDIKGSILKIQNANLKDIDDNDFNIESAFIDISTNTLVGKDVEINFNNKSFNKDNEPRLKGKSIIYDKEKTKITKGIFTTCKKRDNCPPWQLSSEEIKHDKKSKTINYKNAWLKVYDIPVLYFPKFFHPDPTIDRKSGFLIPTIKNSPNSDNYLSVPYFQVVSMNKDLTFIPRLYTDNKFLLQTEYRQVNSKSNHISDFSFFNEENENTKSHLFYEYNKNLSYLKFDESELNLKIQRVSNDTYLKANKVKSKLINNYDVLESNIDFNLYSDDLQIETEMIVYESLNKDNNDRYEFILPKINIVKNIENKTNLDGNFKLNSNNYIKNYQTNVLEKININDLTFNSVPKISKNGFYNNYDFIIKNVNSDTQNSDSFKESENFYLSSLVQFNSSLPLKKENEFFEKILTPKLSLKISPNNNGKDLKDDENRIDISNVYNLNRLSTNDSIESGVSLTYGNSFSIFNKEKSLETFSFNIANNLRLDKNDDLPRKNQIGEKTSNFFSEISYSPSKHLTTKYNATTKNNFQDINYENFIAEISVNNFVTTFDYLNENNTSDKNSYLLSKFNLDLNESNNISFSTRENKTTDLVEYYNFMYQYKNDCLAASIEYNKEYYNDRDVKPEENIFLKLTIIPFGETSSPDLKQ